MVELETFVPDEDAALVDAYQGHGVNWLLEDRERAEAVLESIRS